jgi:sigma-E factor negative regulatory protein RseC
MLKQIEHEGTVASICGNSMTVKIVASSACSGCAAANYCLPSENKSRDIYIDTFTGEFVSGERVKVIMQQSLGMRALCIGFIIPLAVTLATLLAVCFITGNELASGLSALLALFPYWFILKLLNKKISKNFGFTVQKINVI